MRDLFNYSIGIGTIHNRVIEAVEKARRINQSQDLSSIDVALLDVMGMCGTFLTSVKAYAEI